MPHSKPWGLMPGGLTNPPGMNYSLVPHPEVLDAGHD